MKKYTKTHFESKIIKIINSLSLSFLTIALIVCSTISCKSQIQDNKQQKKQQKEQQNTIEYPEDKLVTKDVSTFNEELQGELQMALGDNDIEELIRLLRKGANANKLPGKTDMTPLMLAETQEIALLLIETSANPLVIDTSGKNLLHYAVSKANAVDLIPFYVSLGVDVNARDHEDYTPMSLVINYFHEANAFYPESMIVGNEIIIPNENDFKPNPYNTLKTLVDAGVDLNALNKYGYTIMMDCIVIDNPRIVEILLELGADKNIKSKYGETAKEIAYELGRRYIYQLLE